MTHSLFDQPAPEQKTPRTQIDVDPNGATVTNALFDTSTPTFEDWGHIFARFNLDPEQFEILDDTVRMSSWDQSRRTEGGHRDLIQLYSFSARFRKLPASRLPMMEVQERRKRIARYKPKDRSTGRGAPVAAVINLADVQGGKSEGGGVDATLKRLTDGLQNVQDWLNQCRLYRDVQEIVIVNNGDPMENCSGNYENQPFTVELNLRQQMNFVLDFWELYARTLFPQAPRAQFVSVLCNHGEFGRNSGGVRKNSFTDDSDNAGGFLAETLKRVFDGQPAFQHVKWTIPDDEMNVYTDVNGIPMAFNHGHKIPGKDASGFEKWLNGQARIDPQANAARIWQTAHKHNFQQWEMGTCTVFQAPSLDGGSKWLRDVTGQFSQSGIIAYLVGDHAKLGWSDLAFL